MVIDSLSVLESRKVRSSYHCVTHCINKVLSPPTPTSNIKSTFTIFINEHINGKKTKFCMYN